MKQLSFLPEVSITFGMLLNANEVRLVSELLVFVVAVTVKGVHFAILPDSRDKNDFVLPTLPRAA